MRSAVLLLLTLLGSATHLTAQEPRFVFTPRLGYLSPSVIFEHNTSMTSPMGGESRSTERLRIRGATTLGGHIALRLVGPWQAYGEATYGGSDYDYLDRTESDDHLLGETTYRNSATVTSFALGVGRRLQLGAGAPFFDLTVGGALRRIRAGDLPHTCPHLPGFVPPPCGARRFEHTYNVPSAVGGLTIGHRLSRHVGIQVGATYALGKANTENFWAALTPEYQHLEAPKSFTVHTAHLTAGVALNL